MSELNPFAFLLKKPRCSLDREFYAKAKTFAEIDDPMWLYLLSLVPKGSHSHASGMARMLRTISPQLKTYFLVRRFSGEWGSGGMEGIFLDDEDWGKWIPEAIVAFRSLGAVRHAKLIERVVCDAEEAYRSRSEAELDRFSIRFKKLDHEWEKLAEVEDFFVVVYEDIQRDATPYLHPAEH